MYIFDVFYRCFLSKFIESLQFVPYFVTMLVLTLLKIRDFISNPPLRKFKCFVIFGINTCVDRELQ